MNNSMFNGSNLFERYTTIALMEKFAPVGLMAERVVPPIWYVLGFIGNPMSAAIWLGQRMRRNNSSAIYLGALSISDLIFLLLNLLYILQYAWGIDIYNDYISCEIFNFLYFVPQYLSNFLVLGFTAERYVAVCHPFLKEKLCTVQRAVIIVVCLLFFSMAISTAQIYIWTYNNLINACSIRDEAHADSDSSFWNIWTWVTEMLVFLFVPLTVLMFNILVLKEIFKISKNDLTRRQQNRGGNSTASTITLLAVSFYLIIMQLSATIVSCLQQNFKADNIYMSDEEILNDKTWSNFFTYLEVRKSIEVICLSHYACYFFIYSLTGKHFRKEVLYLVTFKGKVQFLSSLVSKKRRKEQYSMVSTNGGLNSETYATTFSTTM